MSSPEEKWWSIRAGEYVLGTLRGKDLALFEKILAHDTAMQNEVARWERRLASLNESAPAHSPGHHVWPSIVRRVRALDTAEQNKDEVQAAQSTNQVASSANPAEAVPEPVATMAPARRSLFWPTMTGLATAASLVLGILLLQRPTFPMALPLTVDGLAVVLSDEGGIPYFLVETDYGNLRVRVTALSPPSLDASRNFQLWQALPDRSSVRPVALLPAESGTTQIFDVSSLIDGSDLFGVSIEPIGAQTQNGPTGPVVAHGDFLPTRNVR